MIDSSGYVPLVNDSLTHGSTYEKFEGGKPIAVTFVKVGDRFSVNIGELDSNYNALNSRISGRLYLKTLCVGQLDSITNFEQLVERELASLNGTSDAVNVVLKTDKDEPYLFRKAKMSLAFNKTTNSLEYIASNAPKTNASAPKN